MAWSQTLGIMFAVVLAAGCSKGNAGGFADGGYGDHGDGGGHGVTDGSGIPLGDGGDDCASGARWVYLVTKDSKLMRFKPDTMTITPVGTLDCPADSMAAPFSMSVDRSATAWVLYDDGTLYNVSTTDATCTPTSFMPAQYDFQLFGMGFVSDASGSSDETLFVAGGAVMDELTGTPAQLASIDTTSLILSPIGGVPGWPELTGTGTGELWGFFPDTTPPSVHQIRQDDRELYPQLPPLGHRQRGHHPRRSLGLRLLGRPLLHLLPADERSLDERVASRPGRRERHRGDPELGLRDRRRGRVDLRADHADLTLRSG